MVIRYSYNNIMQTDQDAKAKLEVRNASVADIPSIIKLTKKVYLKDPFPYSVGMLRGQINNFPEGQFVAVFEDEIVGYCATFQISEALALNPHTWYEITGGGYASRHDPKGEYLYGMEVCVDPDFRGTRIGQRLYNQRKELCKYKRLRGIIFGGRIPGLSKKTKYKFETPEEYLKLVKEKKIRDKVISFQMRNGFEIIGVLKKYLPHDKESQGFAAHMLWRNPQVDSSQSAFVKKDGGARLPETIRLATVQYQQRKINTFEEFIHCIEYFVDVVADYKADFVVFPELITLQLLSLENRKLTPAESIDALTKYTARYKEFMSELAIKYNINIIGGSHPTKENGEMLNISYVFLRDGSIHEQAKIHPTPNERYWWNMKGGDDLSTIMTDCGPIGVLICYDSEFPELARHLVNQGARILFVPFCTDERQSYLRVRYCAQARAVENQCYVVMSGNVGNLPNVENMDIQYAQSCILTPCDFAFSRDGIAADTTPNVETVAFADIRYENLTVARNTGTVTNLKDRRFDLYSVSWFKH